MSDCPDENVLARFATGHSLEVPGLDVHLDGCESCRRALAAAASTLTLPRSLPVAELTPGVRVGRYEVERELGRGGMGVVYMARDVTLDRRVALKLLHARRDEGAQARLLREAQVMARLAHPNVVPVFELGEWHGDVFLVMELVSGTTLETWLKSAKRSRRDIIRHFVDAGRGLAAAHAAGVVHRDFKPANVLVGLDGRVRVTDFGLSRPGPATLDLPPLASPLVTRDGALVGTVAYMSPEQLDGKPADERSDQFSFCVALVEALTGTRPFEGDSWSTLAVALTKPPKLAGLPRQLRAVLRKGLSVEAGKRYTTMSAMLNALERSPQQGVMAVAALGVALAMAGVVLFRSSPEPVPATVSAPAPVPEETVAIEVAALDLEEGTVVTAAQFEARAMPARYVTSSNVKVEGLSYVLGHRLAVPVQKGDPLLWSAVASEGVDQAPKPAQVVTFLVGTIAKVTRPGVVRIAIGDPGVADPKVKGDTVELMGVGPGTTTMILFTKDGAKELWTLRVAAGDPVQVDPKLPEQISKQDVMETILSARSELATCKTGTGAPVTLSLAWTVLPSGEVRDVRVDSGPAAAPQAKCLLSVVETLEFPKAKKSLAVTFPFKF